MITSGVKSSAVGVDLLDDAPALHHAHPVAHVGDEGEVVADEQVGEPAPLAQVLQQV